jgi:hypothetical protein
LPKLIIKVFLKRHACLLNKPEGVVQIYHNCLFILKRVFFVESTKSDHMQMEEHHHRWRELGDGRRSTPDGDKEIEIRIKE